MSTRRCAAGRRGLWFIAVVIGTLAVGSPVRAAGHAVILQYHNVATDTPPSTSVTPRVFESHLEYLAKNGFTVWPVEKIVTALRQGTELPEKCVGITIDDANRSVYEGALPLLEKHGYPFTVFVTTEAVDKGYRSAMTWAQMREMAGRGAVFAAHGHGHGFLVRRRAGETEEQWAGRVRQDIEFSVKRIGEEIGATPSLFAYPYGEYDAALREIVGALGLVGFGQHSGVLWAGSDFFALPRFPMSAGYAELSEFGEKVNSLPLPVLFAEPLGPVLPAGVSRPVLRLRLAPGDYRSDTIACYAGGQGRIGVALAGNEVSTVEVVAVTSLPQGRSRYTCTARHRTEKRYYWYSHLWIRSEE